MYDISAQYEMLCVACRLRVANEGRSGEKIAWLSTASLAIVAWMNIRVEEVVGARADIR
ncbi:MAG TPA: hypothetical protein VIQ11_19340 [Mycobacterium sp.]